MARRAWAWTGVPVPNRLPPLTVPGPAPVPCRSRAGWRVAGRRAPRALLACGMALMALAARAREAHTQESPARRLANVVGVAVEEYGKAVDARGRLVSDLEYRETVDFLADAKTVAARLSGLRAADAQAMLDTLATAVAAKRPPAAVAALHARFAQVLGPEGALELPGGPLDLAEGRRLYERNCASCHGARGLGDGPAALAGSVPAPAVGAPAAMRDVSPALMYRIVSVGVAGTPMPAWAGTLGPAQRWNVVAYLTHLRATESERRTGEGLYLQRCASCHGAGGASDGAMTATLSTAPPELASFAWQAEHSDAEIAAVLRNGLPGRAMPPSRDLSDAEATSVVAYVRSLGRQQAGRAVAASAARVGGPDAGDSAAAHAAQASRRVLALLNAALDAARGGRAADAGDQAFDAYIAFEPLETVARARNAGLVASMERHFADFKGAVRAGDLRTAGRARDAVEAGLPEVVALTRPTTSRWGAFLQSLLIILREGFEAILVIGAVVTLLVKTGHRERLRAVWAGVGLGLLASAATAAVLATVLRAIPASREVLEGATMLVAVAVLFSISYWLISRAEAAKWQSFIRGKVNDALAHGGGRALALVAFLAVYREGAETALFYQALFQEGAHVALPLALGILAGAALLAVIFTLFYRYGVRVPMRPFFTVTGALLYTMAFVFMGRGVRELQEGNVLPLSVIPSFPQVEALGLYGTWEGLLAQLALVVLAVVALMVTFWPKRSVVLPVTAMAAAEAAAGGAAPAVAAWGPEAFGALEARLARLEADLAALQGPGGRPDGGGVAHAAAHAGGHDEQPATAVASVVGAAAAPIPGAAQGGASHGAAPDAVACAVCAAKARAHAGGEVTR